MQSFVRVGIAVVSVALAGCGASAEETWPGPPEAAPDGTVDIDSFAAHQESVEESWEMSAALAAAKFLELSDRVATNKSIRAVASPEGTGSETVTVVLTGLLDDSVRAERWALEFEPAGEGFRLVSARRVLSCQPDRGHEDFSPTPCL